MFLAYLTGTDELSRLRPLCDRPLVPMPSVYPRVRRLREDMSVFRTRALWCSCLIGLLLLIDKVMRLFDWGLSRSFHSTEWGLPSVRTAYYFFLSFGHSSALFRLRCPRRSSKVSKRRLLYHSVMLPTSFGFLQGVRPVPHGSGVLHNSTPLILLAISTG